MEQATERDVIRLISHDFIATYHQEELELFDSIWNMIPLNSIATKDYRERATELGFWDQILQNPYVTDIVINLVASIIFQLGIYAGGKLVGLTSDRMQRNRIQRELSIKTEDRELVALVMVYVYEQFDKDGKQGVSSESKENP